MHGTSEDLKKKVSVLKNVIPDAALPQIAPTAMTKNESVRPDRARAKERVVRKEKARARKARVSPQELPMAGGLRLRRKQKPSLNQADLQLRGLKSRTFCASTSKTHSVMANAKTEVALIATKRDSLMINTNCYPNTRTLSPYLLKLPELKEKAEVVEKVKVRVKEKENVDVRAKEKANADAEQASGMPQDNG